MIDAKAFADQCGEKLRAVGHDCEMLHMDATTENCPSGDYKFGVGINYMGMKHAWLVRVCARDTESSLINQAVEVALEKINMMVADAA